MSTGDPTGVGRGGSRTARGKRAPAVEINLHIVQAMKMEQYNKIS
ncbi:hypothetical protein ACIQZM_16945 [Peribacillus sp. NPDC097206]